MSTADHVKAARPLSRDQGGLLDGPPDECHMARRRSGSCADPRHRVISAVKVTTGDEAPRRSACRALAGERRRKRRRPPLKAARPGTGWEPLLRGRAAVAPNRRRRGSAPPDEVGEGMAEFVSVEASRELEGQLCGTRPQQSPVTHIEIACRVSDNAEPALFQPPVEFLQGSMRAFQRPTLPTGDDDRRGGATQAHDESAGMPGVVGARSRGRVVGGSRGFEERCEATAHGVAVTGDRSSGSSVHLPATEVSTGEISDVRHFPLPSWAGPSPCGVQR